MSYQEEQVLSDLDGLRKSYVEMIQKCAIYEAAIEAPDKWAVPLIDMREGSFQYIPYEISGLAEIIVELAGLLPDDPDFRHSRQPIRPLSFVEIGCGIGRNLNVLRHQELLPISKAVGFDIVPEYIEVARKIFGLGEDVFVEDAMAFDYSGFDLVFFYRPFSDDTLERKFEEYVMDSVKPGAVIIGLNTERMLKSRKVREIGDSSTLFKKL